MPKGESGSPGSAPECDATSAGFYVSLYEDSIIILTGPYLKMALVIRVNPGIMLATRQIANGESKLILANATTS